MKVVQELLRRIDGDGAVVRSLAAKRTSNELAPGMIRDVLTGRCRCQSE